MSNRPARYSQADLTRALKAASKVNGPWAVEVTPDGTIRIIPSEKQDTKSACAVDKDWKL